MKIEKDEITIRDFTETDLPLMFQWLTDQRVLEYYEGRDVKFTMDTLSAHFLEAIPDGFRMIIEYQKSPIGYAQAYQLSGELFDEYDYPDDGHIVYALDQFIGEPKYWSKGIGSSFLKYPHLHLLSVIVSLTFGIIIPPTNSDFITGKLQLQYSRHFSEIFI